MSKVDEISRKIKDFVNGDIWLWDHLSHDLPAGIHQAVSQNHAEAVQQWWETLNPKEAQSKISDCLKGRYRDVDVDVGRILKNLLMLLAAARGAIAAQCKDEECLRMWAARAANQTGVLGYTGASFDDVGKAVRQVYDALAPAEQDVQQAKLWTLYWLRRDVEGARCLIVPVAGVYQKQGFIAQLQLHLLQSLDPCANGMLLEHPDIALRPLGKGLIQTLYEVFDRANMKQMICWSLAIDEQGISQTVLDGDSLSGPAATAFSLLREGLLYDNRWIVVAGVGTNGNLVTVGDEYLKLRSALNQGHSHAVVSRNHGISQSNLQGLVNDGMTLETCETPEDAVRLVSGLVKGMEGYYQKVFDFPDTDSEGKRFYLEGLKLTGVYVWPDVFLQENVTATEDYPLEEDEQRRTERVPWFKIREDLEEGNTRQCVVLGAPGQGKTLLLQMEARGKAEEGLNCLKKGNIDSAPIPIFVSYKSLADEFEAYRRNAHDTERAFRDYLGNLVKQVCGSEPVARYVSQRAHEGRVWLFLDGLPAHDSAQVMRDLWNTCHQWECRIIATAQRGYDSREAWGKKYRLAPLSSHFSGQQDTLLLKLAGQDEQLKRQIRRMWDEDPHLRQMCENPFLLTLTYWVVKQRNTSASLTKTGIYTDVMTRLLGQGERAGDWLKMLGCLDFKLANYPLQAESLKEGIANCSQRIVPLGAKGKPISADRLSNLSPYQHAQYLIEELVNRGLLSPSVDASKLFLPHPSMHTYLVALHIANSLMGEKEDQGTLQAWLKESFERLQLWQDVFPFTVGILGKEKCYGAVNAILEAFVNAIRGTTRPHQTSDKIPRLLSSFVLPRGRYYHEAKTSDEISKGNLDLLLDCLEDCLFECEARWIPEDLRDEAVDLLLARVDAGQNRLGEQEWKRFANYSWVDRLLILSGRLYLDPDEICHVNNMREFADYPVRTINADDQLVGRIQSAMRSKAGPVRWTALRALVVLTGKGLLAREQVMETIKTYLDTDRSYVVQALAARAVVEICPEACKRDATGMLLKRLRDKKIAAWARGGIISALGRLRDKRAFRFLVPFTQPTKEPSAGTRAQAMWAIQNLAGENLNDKERRLLGRVFRRGLEDTSDRVKTSAISGLVRIRDRESWPHIRKLYAPNASAEIRRTVCWVIARWHIDESFPILVQGIIERIISPGVIKMLEPNHLKIILRGALERLRTGKSSDWIPLSYIINYCSSGCGSSLTDDERGEIASAVSKRLEEIDVACPSPAPREIVSLLLMLQACPRSEQWDRQKVATLIANCLRDLSLDIIALGHLVPALTPSVQRRREAPGIPEPPWGVQETVRGEEESLGASGPQTQEPTLGTENGHIMPVEE